MFTFIVGLITGSYLTFLFYAKVSAVWKNVPDVAAIMRKYRAEKQPHIVKLLNGKYAIRRRISASSYEYAGRKENGYWWDNENAHLRALFETLEEARERLAELTSGDEMIVE